ncbi:MAG: regulatory protein RecX [Deltaproteobacteria bacterium]
MKSRDTEPLSTVQAYQYALRLLTARDYTSHKLRQKLLARQVTAPEAETVLMRLTTEGWLDDHRFAERFAESALLSGRFFGPRLKMEMRRRGVPYDLADKTVGRMQGEYDEVTEIRSVLEHHYPDFSFTVATDREKRRVFSYLQRRGFSGSNIREALREQGRD